MYKTPLFRKTSITQNTSVEGETMEAKVRRIVANNEPVTDGAPLIYTERKDGVLKGMDIRTDRFEVALEAIDKIQKSNQAKREEKLKEPKVIEMKTNGGTEPTQGTNNNN